jgi:hypothetical protein
VNYLDLVNRLKLESGRSGGDLATVVGATSNDLRLVNWTAEAWDTIQRLTHEWRWMRASVLASVTADQVAQDPGADMLIQPADSDPVSNLRSFYPETDDYRMTMLDPADPAGEFELSFLEYPKFRAQYIVGVHDAGRPVWWSISPDNKLMLGPKPDIAYHVRFDYRTAPSALALDADVPEMPEEYHLAIVWGALMSVGAFDNAPEVYASAKYAYNRMISALYMDQGPTFCLGAALA